MRDAPPLQIRGAPGAGSFRTERAGRAVVGVVGGVSIALLHDRIFPCVQVRGESMAPTFAASGERLLLDRPSAALRRYARGDVVVARSPEQEGVLIVKRVVGLPGDTVTCCDDLGQLQVNGVSVDEDAFIRPQADCDGPMPNGCRRDWSVTVPEDLAVELLGLADRYLLNDLKLLCGFTLARRRRLPSASASTAMHSGSGSLPWSCA